MSGFFTNEEFFIMCFFALFYFDADYKIICLLLKKKKFEATDNYREDNVTIGR